MRRSRQDTSQSNLKDRKIKPAATVEGRENQLTALAMDLVEERIRNGTATSAETTHFLKIGSTEARLKKEILKAEKKLVEAKAEALESQKKSEELFANAIKAFKEYSGEAEEDDEYDER